MFMCQEDALEFEETSGDVYWVKKVQVPGYTWGSQICFSCMTGISNSLLNGSIRTSAHFPPLSVTLNFELDKARLTILGKRLCL